MTRTSSLMLAMLALAAGCDDESGERSSCLPPEYDPGGSCSCDEKDALCVADRDDARHALVCVDEHWKGGDERACAAPPAAAFESYVRQRYCRASFPGADGANDMIMLGLFGDDLHLVASVAGARPTDWEIEGDFTTTTEGDELWLQLDSLSGDWPETAPPTLRVGLRRMAVNAWDINLTALPAGLPLPSDLEWVSCWRADPVEGY
jgi:hypothetical protein